MGDERTADDPGRRAVLGAALLATLLPVAGCTSVAGTGVDPTARPFPSVPSSLPRIRRRILAVARHEYEHPGPGTRYAQGVEEPWCADFVSWVLRRAGAPLTNPHSGSWRVPGVLTLWDVLRTTGRFRAPDGSYAPAPGDMVLYDRSSARGEHVNLVVTRDGSRLVVVGGNEGGGIVVSDGRTDQHGLIGFGVPPGA